MSHLENFGLNRNESKVYLALLELGLVSAKPILEKTNLHRQLVYDALDLLIEKGLVSFVVQSNRKYFKASNPEQFKDYFESKKNEIENQKAEFDKLLPKLKAMQNISEKQEATVYRGKKGIKSMLDDMLNEGEDLLIVGASDVKAEAFQYHLGFNIPKFHKIREEKKIKFRIMFGEGLKERAAIINKLKYAKAKVLPKEFTSNTSINIYGDKYSIIIWGKQPLGILVKSKELADAQRRHLEVLWKMAKKSA
jgi:sugar-specific transcriptional regulator TrmB